jgi:hypothetical protein
VKTRSLFNVVFGVQAALLLGIALLAGLWAPGVV